MAPRSVNAVRGQNRPHTDVFGSYAVGVVLVVALLAAEVQAFPVRRRDITTPGTASAGVSGIDHLNPDARRSGLIRHKELSLCVRPAVDFGAEVLPLPERRVSYVAQVFQADRPCIVRNSIGHQFLACYMEQGYRYGSLVAAHASEKTPRAFGANGLDGRAFAANAGTAVIQHPSLEKECSVVRRVGSNHQALDTEVAANNATRGLGFRDLDFVSQAQIPNLPDAFQLGILPPGLRDVGVVKRDGFAEDGYALPCAQEIPFKGKRNRRAFVDTQRPTLHGFLGLVARGHLTKQGAS